MLGILSLEFLLRRSKASSLILQGLPTELTPPLAACNIAPGEGGELCPESRGKASFTVLVASDIKPTGSSLDLMCKLYGVRNTSLDPDSSPSEPPIENSREYSGLLVPNHGGALQGVSVQQDGGPLF